MWREKKSHDKSKSMFLRFTIPPWSDGQKASLLLTSKKRFSRKGLTIFSNLVEASKIPYFCLTPTATTTSRAGPPLISLQPYPARVRVSWEPYSLTLIREGSLVVSTGYLLTFPISKLLGQQTKIEH